MSAIRNTYVIDTEMNSASHRTIPQFRLLKNVKTNYFKENLKKLKEIQKENKIKKESNAPVKALWKSCKYDNVESKLKEYLKVNFSSSAGDDKNNLGFRSARPVSRSGSCLSLNLHSARSNIDFIKLNGCAAKNYSVRRSPSTPNLKDLDKNAINAKHQSGQIPQYLIDRKEEWRKAEEMKKRMNDEKLIPPGHRLMPEAERISTLDQTIKKREDIVNQLSHLPLRNDTTKLRHLKEDLEQKIAKLDDAVRIFSRSKVYVRMDR